MDELNLHDVVLWLTGAGAPVVVIWLLAFLAERWPQWHALSSEIKFILPMLLSVLLTLAATWLLSRPDLIEKYQSIYSIIIGSIIVYLASQKSHQENKAKNSGLQNKLSELVKNESDKTIN